MKRLKIGYQPLSPALTAAGDRRRLLFWANASCHSVVTDLTQKVDVIVASENSDFQSPAFTKKGTPIVFDLIDAYLSPLNIYNDFARGLAKKLSGQISGGVKPFSHYVRNFCLNADAVICSSVEQEFIIKQLNSNTHVILDSHDEFPMIQPKLVKNIPLKGARILWEGQPATIRGVSQISSVLFELSKMKTLHFDFVTDEQYFKYLGKYFKKNTSHLLSTDLGPILDYVKIVPWTPENLVSTAEQASIAMIPIDLSVPMQKLKPENRLLIMWRLGMPCLTSPSPAYTRVARQAGVNVVCESPEAWLENFRHLLNNPNFAHEEILRGQNYLNKNHTKAILLNKWDLAFETVMD